MKKFRYKSPDTPQAERTHVCSFLSAFNPSYTLRRVRYALPSSGPLDGACLHDCLRVALVVRGAVDWSLERAGKRQTLRCRAGEGLVTPVNGWMKANRKPDQPNALIFSIVWQREFTRVLFTNYRETSDATFWHWWYHHPAPRPAALEHLVESLNALALSGGAEETGRLLVQALLLELQAHVSDESSGVFASKGRQSWLMIRDYLHEHFRLPIDRNTVAQVFQLHPNHLSRLFREQGNTGFNEYLNSLRLHNAGRLLLEYPGMPVAEVAKESGFSCSSYFGKLFRRMYGCRPLGYRANHVK